MKNILFFSNQGLSPFHLAVELEILSNLRENKNNQIFILSCDAKLNGCFYNPTKNPVACAICESRTRTFHSKIGQIKKVSLVNRLTTDQTLDEIYSLEYLESLEYKGTNIGKGIASSFISLTRDFEVENPKYKSQLNQLYETAISAYELLKTALKQIKPQEVYLFNGRFAESHVLIELCKKASITYFTHEAASTGHYLLFKNSLPHSIQYRKEVMASTWEKEQAIVRENIAIDFYEKKRNGTFKEAYMHTQNQQKYLLPVEWNPSKKNVVIFNSSEDEMKVIEEWKHNLYRSQNEAIEKICSHYLPNEDIHFTLRIHPNLGKVDNQQSRELNDFDFNNLTIIKANDVIDSYALIEHADLVLSFGSTIGIEATYLKKPSLMFGRTFYEDEDATYNPKSYHEIYTLIDSINLPPKSQNNTYKYGYFMSTFGTEYKHLEYRSHNDVSFRGTKISKWNPQLLGRLMAYLKFLPSWYKLSKIFLRREPRLSELTKLYHQIRK